MIKIPVVTIVLFLGGILPAAMGQSDDAGVSGLRITTKPINARVRIESLTESSDVHHKVDDQPIMLQRGNDYMLVVTKQGFLSYRRVFNVQWTGIRDKNVQLERGIGPVEDEVWVADLEDSVRMEFVPVPAGSFMMGSLEGEQDELPVRRVELKRSFWMAKTEVTNEQYEQFLLSVSGAPNPNTLNNSRYTYKPEPNEVLMPRGAGYPACYVNWNEAVEFCEWLTKKERRRGRLPEGYEYTLPTEAEWEYACRAGTEGSFAGDIDQLAWYKKNAPEKTSPVGTKSPNAWGLHDMHGNVWEWCADIWYGSYTNAPTDGSQRGDAPYEYQVDRSLIEQPGNIHRLVNMKYRVVRGGSWSYSANACRSANRFYHEPDYKLNYLGFRPIVILNPPELTLKTTRILEVDSEGATE